MSHPKYGEPWSVEMDNEPGEIVSWSVTSSKKSGEWYMVHVDPCVNGKVCEQEMEDGEEARAERVVECVNAMAGVEYPQELRDAIDELFISDCWKNPKGHDRLACMATIYLCLMRIRMAMGEDI